MRLVYWTEAFWPSIGGVEVLGAKFIRAIVERGYDAVVVTGHGNRELPDEQAYSEYEFEGIPVHRFPLFQALVNRQVDQIAEIESRLRRFYIDFDPDLFHLNFTGATLLYHSRAAARARRAATVVAIRLALPKQGGRGSMLAGQLLRSADWVTANSSQMLSHTRDLVPEIASCSSLIYNGLDVPDLAPAPLEFGQPRLLCLGRVVDDKGFDVAVDAFPAVLARFPNVRMTIAGDGGARQKLEQQARNLGIDHALEFVGWVERDDIPALINESNVVVVPSRWEEAFGLVALEAAQMARPVVATRVGGLPEVVLHQETGLVVDKEDAAALADSIVFLLERPERAVEMGERARERALRDFGWDRYVDEHDALYRRLTRQCR